MLAKDKKAQDVYWAMCRKYKPIMFSSLFWTLDPRLSWGMQNQPFILRPKQIEVVETLDWCIINGHDAGINKTRDEGASELACKLFSAWIMLYDHVSFIVGSYKKEDVDKLGDDYTLFSKIDNVFQHLPSWMGMKYEDDGGIIYRKDMLIRNKARNSVIVGETTNENFSAGSRATAMLLDEFGRIRKSVTDSIEGTVHPVTNCVIYNSTHWLGEGHTFNNCLKKETTKTVELIWYQNPEKAKGLYKSPEAGQIELVDIEYYEDLISKFGTKFSLDNLPEDYKNLFVADGNKDKVVIYRSPWHDFKEKQSRGNKRAFYCDVWATPIGSSDAVFDNTVLHEIKDKFIREPNFEGEVVFEYNEDRSIEESYFIPNYKERRLKWWGNLINKRPDQRHNYIIGCDPSYGRGSSNSVASIYDMNTKELVGEWVCPNTKPEDFADQVVALGMWCGGVDDTFLIWENNGGHGANFTDRIIWQGYPWCYTQTVEDSKTRKRQKKYGWHSSADKKAALLGEFGIALAYGVDGDKNYKSCVIYSEELLSELFDYVFVEGTKEITTSSKADLSSGARERHGDRAIAGALCVLGTRDQIEGDIKNVKEPPVNSFAFYLEQHKKQQASDKRTKRRFLF
jgi:hypothetical protein